MKMQRPFLTLPVRLRQDRQDGITYNTRFQKGASIQPDDRSTVVQRIEIIITRFVINRIAAMHCDIQRRQVMGAPFVEATWMGPY